MFLTKLSGSFSHTTVEAPCSTAFSINSWPSKLLPSIATNKYLVLMFFELLEILRITKSILPITLVGSRPVNMVSSFFTDLY